jgi:dihydroorotase
MMTLLIKGGRLVDPASSIDALCDLRVRDGAIAEIAADLSPEDGETLLDVTGAVVAPGFVDMHVHLRDPGFPEKETLETGTEAAVRGGFTTVACMPNTSPALDDRAILGDLRGEIARRARCRVFPIAAITLGRKGETPCDYPALARAGAVAFSDDGDMVRDARVLRGAALRAGSVPGPFVSHCDDPEAANVERDLAIAQQTAKTWHIAHISTASSLERVIAARRRGLHVTCEVTPHHLNCTAALTQTMGPAATVNPPLRSEADVQALRKAIRDGSIDALASDHAPHTQREKSGDDGPAAPGFSGLEVAVAAYAAALPDLPMMRFVELLSTNPAKILGQRAGRLAAGDPADVTIFADRSWVVNPRNFASKGKCTPFAGRTLPRKVLATIVGGEIRYRDAEWNK